MIRALKYDKFKLEKSKYCWICMLVSIVLCVVSLVISIYLSNKENLIKVGIESYNEILFSAPSTLIFSIIISIFIGSDFKNGTIKNIASKGISRENIVFSKLLYIYLLACFYVIINILIGLVVVLLMTNQNISINDLTMLLKNTVLTILKMLTFSSIFAFISFLSKNPGVSIAISIGVDSIIPLMALMIDKLIIKSEKLYANNIIPNFVSTIIQLGSNIETQKIIIYVTAMIIETILFSFITTISFKNRDIK